MELLLNLAWLLLALPAFWLWRDARSVRAGRAFMPMQCLLALGCILVILFPVISATDDLRAMRTEIEESPASKRSVRQASHDKTSVWKWQIPQALAGAANSLLVSNEGWQPLPTPSLSLPATPTLERASRAPPDSIPR